MAIVKELITRIKVLVNFVPLNKLKASLNVIKASLKGVINSFRYFKNLAFTIAGTLTGMVAFSKNTSDAVLALDDLSKATQMTKRDLEAYRIAGNRFGLTNEEIASGLSFVNDNLYKAQQGYGNLIPLLNVTGISLRNAKGEFKSVNELIGDFADYASHLTTYREKINLFKLLFGSEAAASKFVRFLEQGNDELQKQLGTIDKTATALSDFDTKEFEEFNKLWSDFKNSLGVVAAKIGKLLIPRLTTIINWFDEAYIKSGSLVNGIKDLLSVFDYISEAIVNLFTNIKKYMPNFLMGQTQPASITPYGAALAKRSQPTMIQENSINFNVASGAILDADGVENYLKNDAQSTVHDLFSRALRQVSENTIIPGY